MANLTLVIDDQLLQSARIKALQENTSVNEICRQAIARYARGGDCDEAQRQARLARVERLLSITRQIKMLPADEPLWAGREALYEEVLSQRVRGGIPLEQPAAPAAMSPSKKRK